MPDGGKLMAVNRLKPYIPNGEFFGGITITEAAKRWKKHPATIRLHIDEGKLKARKSVHVWIISIPSILALYGNPQTSE